MRRGRNLHGELSWGWLALGPGRTPPWPQRCGRLVGVTGGLRPRQQPLGHETSKRVEGRLRQRRENAHLPRGDSCTVPGQERTVSPSLAGRWDPPSLRSPGTPRGPLPATARDQICEGEGLGLPSRRRHSSPPGARRVPSLQKSATSAGLAEASSHGGDPPSLRTSGTPRGHLPATARDKICEGEGLGLPPRRRHSGPPSARRVPSLRKSLISSRDLSRLADPPSLRGTGTPRGPRAGTARDKICEGEGLGHPP